ncbi:MAG: hypothetical protein MUP53_01110 [Bacteroidales bacterium]|nr:hypothetical protein [Bacteroidales bacterium]
MDQSHILFAFSLTLFAGLSMGVGGMIAFFAKRTNTSFLAYSLGFSAGVMIYISFDELLPAAHKYGKHHVAIYGLISGIIVIGLSLILVK